MYLRKANRTPCWYGHFSTVEIFLGLQRKKNRTPRWYVHFSSVEIFPGVSQECSMRGVPVSLRQVYQSRFRMCCATGIRWKNLITITYSEYTGIRVPIIVDVHTVTLVPILRTTTPTNDVFTSTNRVHIGGTVPGLYRIVPYLDLARGAMMRKG
jgi:hypothetical protein